MQISIISAYPLQSQWLSKQLSGHNIHSRIFLPEKFDPNWHCEAIFVPQHLDDNELRFLLAAPFSTPILFWPHCPEHFPEKLKEHTIFLHEALNLNELCLIMKEIIGRNIKKRYSQSIELGELRLERGTRTLHYKTKETRLTKKEFQILELLIMNAGRVTTRTHIVNYVWDSRSYVSPNTIEVYISRLRKKLREFRSSIRTISSLGYELNLPTTH